MKYTHTNDTHTDIPCDTKSCRGTRFIEIAVAIKMRGGGGPHSREGALCGVCFDIYRNEGKIIRADGSEKVWRTRAPFTDKHTARAASFDRVDMSTSKEERRMLQKYREIKAKPGESDDLDELLAGLDQ